MRCPDCGGPVKADMQRGELVCTECGLVVAESEVDTGPEWRFCDREKKERAAPLKLAVKTDMAVRPEHGERWRMLAQMHKRALHRREWKLVEVREELRRVKECAGVTQAAAEEAEALVKKHFSLVAEFPPEAAAVAVMWVAARAAGAPRPLKDFLMCSKADKRRVRKAAWRLNGVKKPHKTPIEEYVKVLAARARVPTSTAKAALEILERNKRRLAGKNPWVWAAAALYLASRLKPGLSKALAEAAGSNPMTVRSAARKLRA